ncbi:MAG TPA: TIGR02221 family CRISPR-associated protein [Spirochaetota bacterium]|nr:TIGR02221 family CRISPR-associated protein [Spirochaetota bacterium]HOM11355.1 TIGR02221 family CRISPR-associated protein [Spirochaetota bacterium]HPP51156.1 TIGR02221 family CRISPR-associated protein [Spirochaetota bacterium]
MAKALLSFLGTNKYIKCNYRYHDTVIYGVHYVQEAIAKIFCNEWSQGDSIIIFVTKEAEEENWEIGKDPENGEIEGLKSVLKKFADNKKIEVRHVPIPGGQNDSEIWGIFDAVINSVEKGSEIIVDVTHAFRAIPMLAVVMINYLHMVKNVTFNGLYYGAVESLGKIEDIKKMPVSERTAPIIDLSSFIYLLQFSNAVNNFMQYGDAEEIHTFTLNAVTPVLRETSGQHDISRRIRRVADDLRKMTQNFAYCRGKDIIKFNYARLYSEIKELKESFGQDQQLLPLKPLQPLLDNILKKIEIFKDYGKEENAVKGILAAQWCLEHNLIQQSITILQESIITLICMRHNLKYSKKDDRELIASAFYKVIDQKNPKTKKDGRKEKSEEGKIQALLVDQMIHSLGKTYHKLSQLRNDINHANFREDEKEPEDIYNEIIEIHKKVMDEVNRTLRLRS